jgi:hypothetical protein
LKAFLNIAGKSLFYLGFCLFVINIIGLFISLRNESIYQVRTGFADDIILTEKELYHRINKPVIDKKEYITNLNEAVNRGIAHYWRDAGINKYNLRIPFYENYLLFIASYLNPEEYLKYEFVNYKRAIERGIGLCSQQAIIVSEILKGKSIPSFIIGLSGHVVLRARVEENRDEWWVLDPDYGVVIPYDIGFIENNPKIIGPFYAKAGYKQKTIVMLEKIYEKKGNVVSRKQGARGYQFKRWRDEPRFYYFKWLIPCTLMTPMIIFYICRRRNKNSFSASKSHIDKLE